MGFGEDETCPIFYHKWVSKRPLVHLLAQKIRFKNGQIRSNFGQSASGLYIRKNTGNPRISGVFAYKSL